MQSFDTLDVVVAGAGLGGLATAAAIVSARPGATVACLESQSLAGGVIRTVKDRGFLVEAGPAGFLDKTGSVTRLADTLGLGDELIASSDDQRVRWIRRNDRLTRFPTSVGRFLTSDLLSWRGKLRMLSEPWRSQATGEETVAAFATRRLGREAADMLVAPIVSGIYAADAGQVSLQACLPHLAALESRGGSLVKAFLRATGNVRPLMSLRGGCGQLIDGLRHRPGDRLICDAPITSVVRRPGGYEIRVGGPNPRTLFTRALASATPAHAASRFLKTVDPDIAWQLAQVRYASVAVVTIGLSRADIAHPLVGFGYLVPPSEDTPVLGVQWSSSIWRDHRAPRDACLLRLFLGGAPNPTLARSPDEELAGLARAELARTFGVTARPIICHVKRHLEAMPQYLLDHHSRVADIERRTRTHPGLFVGGNGLRGLGMDAVVRDAERQASAVVDFLRSDSRATTIETKAPLTQTTGRESSL